MIIHPFCQQTHSLPSENVGSGIHQILIHSSSRCEAKVVADIDHELVIGLQPDDKPRPLFRSDRNCPVCLRDVAYGGLGACREVHDEQCDCWESAPGAQEVITIDVQINQYYIWGGDMRMRKVMDSTIHAWAHRFGDKGQGRRLEGAQCPFQLASCERADVMPCRKLAIDNATIYICEAFDQRVIRGSISSLNLQYSHVKPP